MSVFLSCFRKKKKGDKKKGDKNKNAPIAAPPKEPSPSPKATTNVNKPTITVEQPSDDLIKRRLNESKDSQGTDDGLSDFSAVRETEVLKSYRKPPPPQNRARQSKAPRALLKSSMENLDLFSGTNDELFRSNEDLNTSTPNKSRDEDDDNEKTDTEKEGGANEMDVSVSKMDTTTESSQGRSSMLDEINSTLASIHSSEIRKSAENIAKEAKEKAEAAATNASIDIRKSMEDIAKAVQLKMNAKEKSDDEEVCAPKSNIEVIENVDNTTTESAITDNVGEVEKKDDGVEKNSFEIESTIRSSLRDGIHEVEKVSVEDIACEVKDNIAEDAESKIEITESKVCDSLKVNDGDDDEEEVVITETFQIEPDQIKEKEIKIPPKVSPKPSPRLKPRHVQGHVEAEIPQELPDAIRGSDKEEREEEEKEKEEDEKEKDEEEKEKEEEKEVEKEAEEEKEEAFSSKSFGQRIMEKVEGMVESIVENGNKEEMEDSQENEKEEEKVDSPPPTPTTPTSPTSPNMKGQSRIPTSKKGSGIPKLAFGSPKGPAPSAPSSSPPPAASDSPAKRLDQPDNKAGHTNNTPSSPTSPQGDADPNRSGKESSPFNDDNRNSKRKLTKLRYSGRKKSSESKSDESGSERGSRAGSEAKEDAAEIEKNSRIPVRGGSKPRSSPPKSLGN